MVYAEPLVRVALGNRWIGATPIFQVLAIAALLRPAAATAGGVMLTCGHSRRFFWLGLLTSVALVLGFVAGIPWGPVGIAWAQVWSVYLLLVPKLYWSFKRTPISVGLFFSSIARPLAASLAYAACLRGHSVLFAAAMTHTTQKLRNTLSRRGKRRLVVAAARRLAIDLWRWRTGRVSAEKLGLALPVQNDDPNPACLRCALNSFSPLETARVRIAGRGLWAPISRLYRSFPPYFIWINYNVGIPKTGTTDRTDG